MTIRDALKQELDDVHERFFTCFANADETVLETQPMTGAWSARDVAGHLADWHHEILDAAEHVLGGPAPSGHPIKDIANYNSLRSALRGIETWEQVSGDLRDAWGRASQLLDRLEPEDFARIGELPWGKVDRLEMFFHELDAHTLRHTEQAEAWRLRMLGLRERDR